jgi:cupin fold WbuC family metalloprotein
VNGRPPSPGWITRVEIADLSLAARESARRRKNRNYHEADDAVHRLLNAVEPGTYIRPHRHLHPARSETIVALAGRIGLALFDAEGSVLDLRVLDSSGETVGADLPPEAWHTFVALEPGSVFFETKAGPYAPPAEVDLARWAPPEGSPDSAGFERRLRALFTRT